jgi:DNA-binding transcriptional MerR regulator
MSDNVVELRPNQGILPRDERDWVTSHELLTDASITYRQLDYWCRTGLLTTIHNPNPGSGHLRVFPLSQLERARAVRELLDAGMALTVIRDVVDQYAAHGHVVVGGITLTRNQSGDTPA